MGRWFAHQRFADSRESIRFARKKPVLEALGQIRANRVFSPIRIQIRVIRVQSSLLSIFWKVDSLKKFFFFSKRESIRANRPTKVSPILELGPLLHTSGVFDKQRRRRWLIKRAIRRWRKTRRRRTMSRGGRERIVVPFCSDIVALLCVFSLAFLVTVISVLAALIVLSSAWFLGPFWFFSSVTLVASFRFEVGYS